MIPDLADVLRAECVGKDLVDGPNGIHVLAMKADGTLYELGWVSPQLVFQDPAGARMCIGRIKFRRRGLGISRLIPVEKGD